MLVKLATIVRLSLFLSVGRFSSISEKIVEEHTPKKVGFFDLPNELAEMIFKADLEAYYPFISAFYKWHGLHTIELENLKRIILKEKVTWKDIEEAGYMALRLSASEPLDPENPDIMKVQPAFLIKWLRYLEAHCAKKNNHFNRLSLALFSFARSPDFTAWYDLWTQDEKDEFRDIMADALFMTGKIDIAYDVVDLQLSRRILYGGVNFYSLYFACLNDDLQHLENVKSVLSERVGFKQSDVLLAAIEAKAIKIIEKYVQIPEAISDGQLYTFKKAASLQDENVFSPVLEACLKSPNFDHFPALQYIALFHTKPHLVSAVLEKVDIFKLSDNEITLLLKKAISISNMVAYSMILEWISQRDKERMNLIARDLVPFALTSSTKDFIEHLLTKSGIEHAFILQQLINLPKYKRSEIPLKYLLTPVLSEDEAEVFPIHGSNEFFSHDLLPFLIEGEFGEGCKIALSADEHGQRVYPFVEVSQEAVALAVEKYPLCLLHFPPDLVNNYIYSNPECFRRNGDLCAVLTSAKNGKPRFSAMDKYWNVEYLMQVFSDPSFSRDLEFFDRRFNSYKAVESMFGLLEFTPELNDAINERVLPQAEISEGQTIYRFPYKDAFKYLLSKKSNGELNFKSFRFTKNILFDHPLMFSVVDTDHNSPKFLLSSHNGDLLFGLSLVHKDEDGKKTHYLAELPKYASFHENFEIQNTVDILLKTNGKGKFVLNEINEEIVRKIAEEYANTTKWYSDFLLKKLDTLSPPWPEW